MILRIYPQNPAEREIRRVVEALERDGVVVYPTDSVYAYGCSLRSARGLERLRQLSRKTIGVRIPDNAIPRAIVEQLGCPLITASLKSDDDAEYMTDPELIHERYGREVALVVDGGYGSIVPTTVVDLTQEEPEIVRQGAAELN